MRAANRPSLQANPGCRNVSLLVCKLTRREASALLLGTVTGPAAVWSPAAAAPPPKRGSSCLPLDPALSAAFMEAVYSTVQQQQVVAVEQLQRERYKLQTQEYKYFLASNKERLPAIPDLSDNSGGLSNPVFFSFVSYILWKSVAKHLPSPEQRTAFCTGVGEQLLQQLSPQVQQQLQAAAAAAAPGGGQQLRQAPAAAVLSALQQLLQQLQAGGYICGYQLVWDSLPGGWPGDWASSQPQLVDAEAVLQQRDTPIAAGSVFQLKLQQPADIEGSVALRSEEDGFWSRHVSSLVAALLHAGGYSPSVDEYWSQDYWSGPQRTADKLLQMFGDPLQQVQVPWNPTTLVQNWSL